MKGITRNISSNFVKILLSLIIISACSGEKSKTFVVMDNEMNQIGFGMQFELQIPAGAIEQAHACKISENNHAVLPKMPGLEVYGRVFSVEHDGIELLQAARVKLIFEGIFDQEKFAIARSDGTRVELLATQYEDGYLLAETMAFSEFFIVKAINKITGLPRVEKPVERGIEEEELTVHTIPGERYYEAYHLGGEILPVYKKPFTLVKTGKISEIAPEVKFLVRVGFEDAECKEVLTFNGVKGYVKTQNIDYRANYNGFLDSKYIKSEQINVDEIVVQKSLINAAKHKDAISEAYEIQLRTASREGRNYLLLELISNTPDQLILTYRNAIGMIIPSRFGLDNRNMEVNYYGRDGLFIDARMHELAYEDNLYRIVNNVSGAITGVNQDQIMQFMESLGVGELDFGSKGSVSIPVSDQDQIIEGQIGSFVDANSLDYPSSSLLQVAIPFSGDRAALENYLLSNPLKLFLGVYLNNTHRCVIVKGEVKEFGPELGPEPEQIQSSTACGPQSIEGDFTVDKVAELLFEKHWYADDFLCWNHSDFLMHENLKDYKRQDYFPSTNKVYDIGRSIKVFITEVESDNSYVAKMHGNLLGISIFRKCPGGWTLSASKTCLSGHYYYYSEVHNLGTAIGVLLTPYRAQGGYGSGYTYLIVPELDLEQLLEASTYGDNSGASTSASSEWAYESEFIIENTGNQRGSDIIIHKFGTYLKENDSYSGGTVVPLDSMIRYRYNGQKYTRNLVVGLPSEAKSNIIGTYYAGLGWRLEFARDDSGLRVKMPDKELYPGWRPLAVSNGRSNVFEFSTGDGDYVFEYHNKGGEEYILMRNWYSDGESVKFCKDYPCEN